MSDHVDKWLPRFVKGNLSDQRRSQVVDHIEDCDRCADELEHVREDISLLASRDSTSPSDDLRDQILRDLSPEDRFLDLIDEVETRLDLSESEARRLLAALDDESNWISVPGYDIDLFGFRFVGIEPGPQVEAELAALLRVARGATFPEHEHVGREQVFVLQGTLIEDDGEVFDRGELIEHDHETSHTFSVPDDSPDLIGIVCVEHGLLIDGIPLGDVI